jgi:hypothetical protein
MKHKDAIGTMYFVTGYLTSIALMISGESLYHKLFGVCMGFYLTWHIMNGYEN